MRLRRILAVWAAKLAEKISVHILPPPGSDLGGEDRTATGSFDPEDTGVPGEEGYLYRMRDQWKDDHQ